MGFSALAASLFLSCSPTPIIFGTHLDPGFTSISGDSAFQVASYLASEKFSGREAGSPGLDSALIFVHEKLQKNGLVPFGSQKSLFHPFDVKVNYSDADSAFFLAGSQQLTFGVDYTPFYLDHKVSYSYSGDLIFDGYGYKPEGILASELSENPVKNKWVLLAPGFPAGSKKTKFNDPGGLITKLAAYQALGVAGILMLPDSSLSAEFEERSHYLTSDHFELISETISFPGLKSLPVFVLTDQAAGLLLKEFKIDAEKFSNLIGKGLPLPKSGTFIQAKSELRLKSKNMEISNLVGSIPGKSSDEIILIGAHLDHLGKKKDGSYYPGADDNASGVSVVLELARVLQLAEKAGLKPEKTLVFAIFNGEEKGLLGSAALSEDFSASGIKVKTMINLDMVGRESQDSIEIVGHNRLSSQFKEFVESFDKRSGLIFSQKLNIPGLTGDVFYRSDHYPFARKDIPVLFLTDGMGENWQRQSESDDYHLQSDTSDKLNKKKLERVTRLCYQLISGLSKTQLVFRYNQDQTDP